MVSVTNQEVSDLVYNMITGIPVGISGVLLDLTNQSIYTAENIIEINIPILSIADAYQPGITNLTAGTVLSLMESQGIGTKSVNIDGAIQFSKGIVEGTSASLKELGLKQLNDVARIVGDTIYSYQTWN